MNWNCHTLISLDCPVRLLAEPGTWVLCSWLFSGQIKKLKILPSGLQSKSWIVLEPSRCLVFVSSGTKALAEMPLPLLAVVMQLYWVWLPSALGREAVSCCWFSIFIQDEFSQNCVTPPGDYGTVNIAYFLPEVSEKPHKTTGVMVNT